MKEIIIAFTKSKSARLLPRLILGGVFVYASLDKIAFPKEFARIVISYHMLPDKIALYFSLVLPWVELILGIFLIVGFCIRESALGFSVLLLVFISVITIKSIGGTLESCGCFSVLHLNKGEDILPLIARDLCLFGLGISIYFTERKGSSKINSNG
jgi:uncharacterized membrane protein YphA (DoxX/SURF4 family)